MKVGTKLVCIKGGIWNGWDGTTFQGLNKGDIVTFDGFNISGLAICKDYIHLKEVHTKNSYGKRIAFAPQYFRPLLGQSATAELVSSFNEITETSDLPIRSPQTETV